MKTGSPFAGEEKQLREGGRGLCWKGNRVRQQLIMIILDMTQIKRLCDLVCMRYQLYVMIGGLVLIV